MNRIVYITEPLVKILHQPKFSLVAEFFKAASVVSPS